MMKKNSLHAFLFALLLFGGLLFAQDSCSISSVTTSSSVSKATTGTSVVISSVSTATSQCTATQLQLISSGANTGGALTINDPPSPGYYSNTLISTSGTTKTFTVTAGTEDVYTYNVQATYTGGSQSSTGTIIEFVSPSTFTVSGTPSSATVTQGSSTTITINVQNPGTSSVTSSYNLSYDASKMTITGDARNGSLTIAAGTTQTLTFTVAPTSNGTATFQLGSNTNAFTSTIGVTSSLTASGTPSSASVYVGNPFTLTITVSNTGASSQTSTYNLSYNPSLVSTSTASSGSVTVAASGTSTLSWTLTGVSSGTGSVIFQLGSNTSAFTSAVTVTWPSGSSGSGSSSGTTTTTTTTPTTTTPPTTTPPATTPPEVTTPSTPTAPPPTSAIVIQASLDAPTQATLGDTITLTLTANNAPAPNVAVKISTPSGKIVSKTTDENGRATFVATEEGFYDYSAEGYSIGLVETFVKTQAVTTPPVTPPTTAPAEITPPAQIVIGEPTRVTVIVGGQPAANVQVTVTAPDGGKFKVTTDASGIATFTPTQAGNYAFSLASSPQTQPKTVSAQQATPTADYSWILLAAGVIIVLIIIAGLALWMMKPKKY
ncbi:DUF4198 domain-containing protein [Candidatus Micrarchaeota archaeon]|nr:DUF4198 domain-containing protein [Candidatus Micrarchaeota archaeon]